MKLEVVDIKDNEDGSETLLVNMDESTIKKLASIGLLKVITDAANDIIDDHKETTEPTVESLINDAIKILERRPQAAEEHATLIDALVETIQDAINTLVVAKSLLDATET